MLPAAWQHDRAIHSAGNLTLMAILRRALLWPFSLLRALVLRATFAVALATCPKTTYREIRILLGPCEDESQRESIEFAREVLDLLHEREPHRFERLRRAVDNIILSSDAGGGLYVPQTRSLVIDLSYLAACEDEDHDLVLGFVAALMLHHVTYHKLAGLRADWDESHLARIDHICTREIARWFSRWYPDIYRAIDWDEVADCTDQRRRQMNRLSLLDRFREQKRALQDNPLAAGAGGGMDESA